MLNVVPWQVEEDEASIAAAFVKDMTWVVPAGTETDSAV
jgi:hypothetical protein